jgi:DNA invertase Pin-like site-specific DNA recombinase
MWAWVQLVENEISTPRQAVGTASKSLFTESIQSLVSRPVLLDRPVTGPSRRKGGGNMIAPIQSKVKATHLSRKAYLYVRQSTLRQVIENQESTRRQYALRERAVSLGWPSEQIVVIDSDLGCSAASSSDREGFQKLVGDVGMGRAGVVLGLEVSRLARNSSDWHRLLEICALTDTLILDEDGLYDPSQYNDRLLLGLKGTMSEAELHMLRARLRGGMLAKAQRGEFRIKLPVGLVYDEQGRVALHPDVQVREALGMFFKTFSRIGTACGVVRYYKEHGLLFPKPNGVMNTDDVIWGRLDLCRAVRLLHNPRYAGAYVYGRRHESRLPNGRSKKESLPREQWPVLLLDAHSGYISWQQYEHNQEQLRKTALAFGQDRRQGAPREGPALLQGLAICGVCGSRMAVRYHRRKDQLIPDYFCCIRGLPYRDPGCQFIPGGAIDEAVGKLLIDTMTPMALELTMAVQSEIQTRLDEANKLRDKQVERARYEAELARRRYMQVDPDNRLVACSLESEWNDKLRAFEEVREQAEYKREQESASFDDTMRGRILELSADLPAIWNHPGTPHRERKRIAALLIEDVTLVKAEVLKVHIRFRGGATTTLTLQRPLMAQEQFATKPEVVAEIDELLARHTKKEVIAILNERGHRTGMDRPFNMDSLTWIMYNHGIKSQKQRLRKAGFLTRKGLADTLGLSYWQIKDRQSRGLFRARAVNDKGEWLFNPIPEQPEQIQQLAAEHSRFIRNRLSTTSTAGGAV